MSHKELEKLYKQDQADRKNKDLLEDFEKMSKRDQERRKKADKIIKRADTKTARDLYIMAMLYQHGPSIADSKKAIQFAKKSMGMGSNDAKWLFAAATDRLLVKQGRKQKFGTQFFRDSKTGKVSVRPINKRTTDKMRKEFNVPPFKEVLHKLKWY